MKSQQNIQRGFSVRIRRDAASPNAFHVTYVPRGLPQSMGASGKPKQHTALVPLHVQGAPIQWDDPPRDREVTLHEFEQDAHRRAGLLQKWLACLSSLIQSVRKWAGELGWSTREIEKSMEDSEIGAYKAPALLLQEETTKALVEPIARATPGSEGVVDLYLMPGYDDIASVYCIGNKWNIRYMPAEPFANIRDAESKPLSKASLRKVLEEMKSHVG